MIGLTSGGGGITLVIEDESDLGLKKSINIKLYKKTIPTYEDSSFLISSDFGDPLSSSFSLATLHNQIKI